MFKSDLANEFVTHHALIKELMRSWIHPMRGNIISISPLRHWRSNTDRWQSPNKMAEPSEDGYRVRVT